MNDGAGGVLYGAGMSGLDESLLELAPEPKRLSERAGPSASVVVHSHRPSAARRNRSRIDAARDECRNSHNK